MPVTGSCALKGAAALIRLSFRNNDFSFLGVSVVAIENRHVPDHVYQLGGGDLLSGIKA